MSRQSQAVFFIGPEPVPALASGLPVICADSLGVAGAGLQAFPEAGRSSQALLDWAPAQRLLRERAQGIIVWKSSVAAERQAQGLGIPIANSSAKVARRLENKAYFSRAAAAQGLPLPETVAGPAGPELLEPALALGLPLVFQLAHGFSGASTYPVASEVELRRLLLAFASRACRIAEMVEGTPVTVTGVAFPDQVVTGPACRQLTGIPLLTPYPLGSCGNDFQARVPHRELVEETAARVGAWLREQGHRGVFGVDLVVSDAGRCWCIEVNPRLVASVPLWTLSARDRGEPSLLDQHLSCFGFGPQLPAPLRCHWSQLILYRQSDPPPSSASPGGPRTATARGRLGRDGTFTATAPLSLEGPAAGEAALVVRSASRSGHELARLITEGPVTSADGQLLPGLQTYVGQLRSLLESGG
ncbi:MAG: ATP-grasp domain-containing protein [Candidatus Dormibacteria bacterium]